MVPALLGVRLRGEVMTRYKASDCIHLYLQVKLKGKERKVKWQGTVLKRQLKKSIQGVFLYRLEPHIVCDQSP